MADDDETTGDPTPLHPPPAQGRPECNAITLAHLVGVTEQTITALARRGIMVRTKHGKFDWTTSVQRYCAYPRDLAAEAGSGAVMAANERGRLAREQADRVALKNAVMRGALLDASQVESEWSGVLRAVRAGWLSA